MKGPVSLDFSNYFSVEDQFSRKLESPCDFYARVQDVLGCFSALREWNVLRLWANKFSPLLRLPQPIHYFVGSPLLFEWSRQSNRLQFEKYAIARPLSIVYADMKPKALSGSGSGSGTLFKS